MLIMTEGVVAGLAARRCPQGTATAPVERRRKGRRKTRKLGREDRRKEEAARKGDG